jgi:hypothetical protein
MSKGLSIIGGFLINGHTSLNSEQGDALVCSHCHLPIPLLRRNGCPYRENRVDCEDKEIESYHLDCYDLALLGKVLPMTLKRMAKIKEEFGES